MCIYFDVFKKTLMPEFTGKEISQIYLDGEYNNGDGGIIIEFSENEKKIILFDDKRACCESRYVHCDDALDHYDGSIFKAIQIKRTEKFRDDLGEDHEIQFVHIVTNVGTVVAETHNIHDGNYGGFDLKVDLLGEKN